MLKIIKNFYLKKLFFLIFKIKKIKKIFYFILFNFNFQMQFSKNYYLFKIFRKKINNIFQFY